MWNKRERIILTDEKFQDIYSDKKFRNEVAFAHKCVDGNLKFSHYATCSYPQEYIVTEEQIELAKAERDRARTQLLEDKKGWLLMDGMGSEIEPQFDGHIPNHRVRGYFLNDKGEKCFLEVATSRDIKLMRVTHSNCGHDEYYKNLDRRANHDYLRIPYSHKALLEIVNYEFGCSFKNIHVDNYDYYYEDVISVAQ